jgi:hypothetical protein
MWVDGVYSGLRGDNGKLCALVVKKREKAIFSY